MTAAETGSATRAGTPSQPERVAQACDHNVWVDQRYLVTRPLPFSGIGSNLVSLAGAVWLAGEIGRTVVVDWRGSRFFRDEKLNPFVEFFECPDEIEGVPMRYAPDLGGADLDALEADAVEVDSAGARALLGERSGPPVIVLRSFHGYERVEPDGDRLEQLRRLRGFYRSIVPRPFVRAEIDRFAAEHRFDESFVVAANIATGNGDYRKGAPYASRVNTRIFENGDRFLARVALARSRALRRLPRHVRDGSPDLRRDRRRVHAGAAAAAAERGHAARALSPAGQRSRLLPGTRGSATTSGTSSSTSSSTTSCSRAATRSSNGSMFSHYALVTTDWFNGNVHEIEALYPRYWVDTARSRAKRLAGTGIEAARGQLPGRHPADGAARGDLLGDRADLRQADPRPCARVDRLAARAGRRAARRARPERRLGRHGAQQRDGTREGHAPRVHGRRRRVPPRRARDDAPLRPGSPGPDRHLSPAPRRLRLRGRDPVRSGSRRRKAAWTTPRRRCTACRTCPDDWERFARSRETLAAKGTSLSSPRRCGSRATRSGATR